MAMDGTTFGVVAHQPPRGAPIICFSHLRLDFVFQRSQQIMSRFARTRLVFFFEEPVEGAACRLGQRVCPATGVTIVTPCLPQGAGATELRGLLDALVTGIGPSVA